MLYKFKRSSRLKNNRNFQIVYQNGKSYVNKWAVLYVLKQTASPRRIGFAVGKKLGNAVVRNRVKRLMREVFRLNQHKIVEGIDILFVARKPLLKANLIVTNNTFWDLCKKAGILISE